MSISLSCFPHELKKSETSPLYKSQDNLEPQNYRSLSVLTCLSKIFERVYNDQMGVYFKDILSTLLSAFRKRYGCHHVLTKLLENSKQALDEGTNVGLILLDLSKVFDCLPHRLLLCKLNAYGISYEACNLIKSYLCQRLQRVKVASTRSQWQIMQKGVPQGSVLGPLLFNIFINDIIYELQGVCSLHNYADDNTICCSYSDMNILKINLKKKPFKRWNGSKTITWRQIRLSFKPYYSNVEKMNRFSILILVMSWSNLCPLWNCWVFLLMTTWALMNMSLPYVWRPHGRQMRYEEL